MYQRMGTNRKWHLLYFSFLLLGLVLASKSNAQNIPKSNKGLAVYTMPFSMVLPDLPRIRLGGEYFSGNSFSYGMDIGIGTKGLYDYKNKMNLSVRNYFFYEIRPEIKWYREEKEHRSRYFALELFYIKATKSYENNSYYPFNSGGFQVTFDTADWAFSKKGFHLKMGGKVIGKNKPFFMEGYMGSGLVKRSFLYSNIVNPVKATYPEIQKLIFYDTKEEKDDIVGHFSLGLKLGYIFWKNE